MAKVTFAQTLANYYVRDPRVVKPRVNGFYNDNSSTTLLNGMRSPMVYNPGQALPGTATYGALTGYGSKYQYPGVGQTSSGYVSTFGNFQPTSQNYGVAAVVPGLTNGTQTYDPAAAFSVLPIPNKQAPPTDITYPSQARLDSNNIPAGADYKNSFNISDAAPDPSFDVGQDNRVFVTDPSGKIVKSGAVMTPLAAMGGVLFPYTPVITFAHKANYESEQLMHTNYEMPTYKNSNVDNIGMQAKFTANNSDEAQYVLAVIQFFRAATKMFYGADDIAGTPPPVLRLDGYGAYMINHLPVVVTSFDYSLPEEVDYISTNSSSSSSGPETPNNIQMNISFKLVYSRNKIANKFGMQQFAGGNLLSSDKRGTGGSGGWI